MSRPRRIRLGDVLALTVGVLAVLAGLTLAYLSARIAGGP